MIQQIGRDEAHEKIWDLIPWFVNGRLGMEDAAAVEAHLSACASCRDECELQARIHDAIRDESSVAFATEGSYRKLADRLESTGAVAGGGTRSRRVVMWMAAALAVESVALVAWGAWGWFGPRAPEARYVTLSSDGSAVAPVSRGTLVRVVFAQAVALSDVENLLRATEARVIDGPTERGVYTIEMKGKDALSADRLRALRGSELVRFAEPVMVGASGAP
jgi:hypothetical protein